MMPLRLIVFIVVTLMTSFALAEELSIASWNIKTIEVKRVNHVEEWNLRLPYIASFIEFMNHDVIGMQEATSVQIETLLERLPQYRYVGVASRDGKKNGNGNPIFYKPEKLDLKESHTFWLSETPNKPSMGWDTDSKRICTWAIFKDKITKKSFMVFNTHLDHKGREARENGVKLILDSLSKYTGYPIFLMGDFNAEKGSRTLNWVKNGGILKDSYEIAQKRFSVGGTFNGFRFDDEPRKTIDFIFVNEYVSVLHYSVVNNFYWENGKPNFFSDHYPVQLKCDITMVEY